MQFRRPRFYRGRRCSATRGERREITADAEQSSARGNQHRPHIVALAQFSHAKAEFAAKFTVDRVAAVGLIEHDVRKPAIDGAFKALRDDCQTHRVSPRLFGLFGNAYEPAAACRIPDSTARYLKPTSPLFPCAWKLEWPPAHAASPPAKASRVLQRCSVPPDDVRHRC